MANQDLRLSWKTNPLAEEKEGILYLASCSSSLQKDSSGFSHALVDSGFLIWSGNL
jgi:hypothetical protein